MPRTLVARFRRLLFTYSRIYMEEFSGNEDIVKAIATEIGGVDVFLEEYKRSEFFI